MNKLNRFIKKFKNAKKVRQMAPDHSKRGMMGTAMVVLAVAGVLVYVGSTVLSQMGRTTINRAAIQTAQKEVSQLAIKLAESASAKDLQLKLDNGSDLTKIKVLEPGVNVTMYTDPWGQAYQKEVFPLPSGSDLEINDANKVNAVKDKYSEIKNRSAMVVYSKGPNRQMDIDFDKIKANPEKIGNFGDDIFEILTYGDIERIHLSTKAERTTESSLPNSEGLRFNPDTGLWVNVDIDDKLLTLEGDLSRSDTGHFWWNEKIIRDLDEITLNYSKKIWDTKFDFGPENTCLPGQTPKVESIFNGVLMWNCVSLSNNSENMECVQVSMKNGSDDTLQLTYRSPTAVTKGIRVNNVINYFKAKKPNEANSSVSEIKAADVTFFDQHVDLVGFTGKDNWRVMSCSRARDDVNDDQQGVYLIDNSCLDWEPGKDGFITGTLCRPAASFDIQPPAHCNGKSLQWTGNAFECIKNTVQDPDPTDTMCPNGRFNMADHLPEYSDSKSIYANGKFEDAEAYYTSLNPNIYSVNNFSGYSYSYGNSFSQIYDNCKCASHYILRRDLTSNIYNYEIGSVGITSSGISLYTYGGNGYPDSLEFYSNNPTLVYKYRHNYNNTVRFPTFYWKKCPVMRPIDLNSESCRDDEVQFPSADGNPDLAICISRE